MSSRLVGVTAVVGGAFVVAFLAANAMWLQLVGSAGLAVLLVLVLRSPSTAMLAWVLAGPMLYSWVGTRLGGGITVTPDRVLFLLLVGVVLARWIGGRGARRSLGPTELAMGLFLTLAGVTLLARGGTPLTPSIGGLKHDLIYLAQGYGMPFTAFVLAKYLLSPARDASRLCWTLVGLAAIVGSFGVLQQFVGMGLLPNTGYVVTSEERSFGTLTGPSEFGIVVTVGFFAALLVLPDTRAPARRLLLFGVLAVCLAAIVYSKTRGVMLGLFVGLAVVARHDARLRRPILVASIVGVLLLAGAWSFLAQTDLVRYRLLELSPVYNRIALSATALNLASDAPLLGHGFGRYVFATEKWGHITSLPGVPAWYAVDPGVPHNEFLHVLVQLGLVGLALYLVPMWRGFRNARRFRDATRDEGAARFAMLAMTTVAVYVTNGLMVDLAACTYASIVLYSVLGCAEALGTESEPTAGRLPP